MPLLDSTTYKTVSETIWLRDNSPFPAKLAARDGISETRLSPAAADRQRRILARDETRNQVAATLPPLLVLAGAWRYSFAFFQDGVARAEVCFPLAGFLPSTER